MSVYIEGLALKGYRGIGAELQILAPFKRFNFFIGANNVGKSTVLMFLADRLSEGLRFEYNVYGQDKAVAFSSLEKYRGGTTTKLEAAIAVSFNRFKDCVWEKVPNLRAQYDQTAIESCLNLFQDEAGFVWFRLNYDKAGRKELFFPITAEKLNSMDAHNWQRIWLCLKPNRYGGDLNTWRLEIFQDLISAQDLHLPVPILIPAIRQIGPKDEALNDHSGKGLVDRLAELQNPSFEQRGDREAFEKINLFIRAVLSDECASIEIPHDRENVLVHMDNRVLPLKALGTGVHEVILIAAFCTINENKIVCIEEPEIHLHPLLQKKLMKYLIHNTSNQYFIATHSAALMDTPDSAIFHVTKDKQQTYFSESILRRDRLRICADLGYRASDVLQSNCIIWVEGPSDRIYLRWWLNNMVPDFLEGVHFSIMFYGGRLLSHLSADDADVQEFIDLRAINQYTSIIIDSDRTVPTDLLNRTKERVSNEFNAGPGSAWVTEGREIENYIPHDNLQSAVKQAYASSYIRPASGGLFDHALHFMRASPTTGEEEVFCNIDKVKIARNIAQSAPNLDLYNLRASLQSIVDLIEKANT